MKTLIILSLAFLNYTAQAKKTEGVQNTPVSISSVVQTDHHIYTTTNVASKECGGKGYEDCSWLQQGQTLYCCKGEISR